MLLGFGMVSYMKMLKYLILTFFVLSLLLIPSMYIFSMYDSYDPSDYTTYSLGNMGFSD